MTVQSKLSGELPAALGGTLTAGLATGRWRVRAVLPTGVGEG
ncbi:MAG: hypothetical protein ABR608_14485 [Pseudonocardiaceae bacterium]